MFLLVGLGNPGIKFERNRHNIGFLIADEIHREFGFSSYRKKFEGEFADGQIENHKVLLLKPSTFMNESGRSVRAVVQFYKVPIENVIVFHDEIDLVPGKIKIKLGGGFAGHNGLKSLGQHLDIKFLRVRVGVGHPGSKDIVENHVLGNFSVSEEEFMSEVITLLARAVPLLLSRKNEQFIEQVGVSIGC